MSVGPPLISVVVPAFNAEATIGATLEGVRSQTHRALEVVVVDDGSTDGTARIVERFVAEDSRIRLLRQQNRGVARARNAGFAMTRGAYIAPLDADDLWHPRKLELQLAAMQAGGPSVGFVYTFFRRIDFAGHVLYEGGTSGARGRLFLRHLLANPVCNGSALLVRREAWISADGYSPELQDRGAQGCEDFLFQLLIARNWEVELVPAFLTGYRETPDAMSANRERMRRSHLLMYEIIERRYPETPVRVLALAQIPIRLGNSARACMRLRPQVAREQLAECVRLAARCSVRDKLWVLRYGLARVVRKLGPKLELLGHRVLARARIVRQARVKGPVFEACDPMVPLGGKVRRPGWRWAGRLPAVDDGLILAAADRGGRNGTDNAALAAGGGGTRPDQNLHLV
jgi:glycosyltransferase involved in cell wall biosynthesis